MTSESDVFSSLPDDIKKGIEELGWTQPMPVQEKAIPKMKAGGLVLFHDYGWAEGVRSAIGELVVPLQVEAPVTLPNLYAVRIDPARNPLEKV